MNKRNMQWLYNELPKLIDKGILTSQAADQIRQYYGEVKPGIKRWLALIICGVFGALLIGLGIILLLGHNWENLSRGFRAFLSVLPLICGQLLGGWVLWKRNDSVAWKEATATFITLMIGSSIALVSQTYNIPGDLDTFLLSWALLAIPLVYLMQASIPAVLYLVGITAWGSTKSYTNYSQALLFWPMAALVIPHFIKAIKQELYAIRAIILSWTIAICFYIGTSQTLGKSWDGLWVIIYSSLFSFMYLLGNFELGQTKTDWQRPQRTIGGIGIFVLSLILTFRATWQFFDKSYYWFSYFKQQPNRFALIADYSLITILLAAALLLIVNCARKQQLEKLLFGIMPIIAIAVVGYSLSYNSNGTIFAVLLFNIYLFILSVSKIVTGVKEMRLGVLNIGMLMLSALLVARFFDSGMSFVARGLIFIILGICFLATNIFFIRRKGGTPEVKNEK